MRWAPYVPVAKRRAAAAKKVKQLQKKGHIIQPIEIEGRTIARTFWGKAWCTHMESYCDQSNRLPRGRTYVRNGSVCHLEINAGQLKAMVSGSSLYHITISVKPLSGETWQAIKRTCMGKISSLLDFLSGKLSSGVMEEICHANHGLFPVSDDLDLHCDCPDYAIMCKHVAAVLYGVGARLDVDPAQLFTLRGVNFEELMDVNQAVQDVTSTQSGRRKRLDDAAFTDLFDFEATEEPGSTEASAHHHASMDFPARLTGQAIVDKRLQLNLTKQAFAKRVGVSVTSITLWEAQGDKTLRLQAASLRKLQAAWS